MAVMINEDSADPSVHEPRVTGSPDAIWLVYGDLEQDATHAECSDRGAVLWCEDAQFAADVRYTRTDLVAERVAGAAAAERERWTTAARLVLEATPEQMPLALDALRDVLGG
jgi:hypothetical protein